VTRALAILYVDPPDSEWKSTAALGLDGISDRSVQAFWMLWAAQDALGQTADEYPIVVLTATAIANNTQLAGLGWSADVWIAVVEDLLVRGLIGRTCRARCA
jgi:hypothetical protein